MADYQRQFIQQLYPYALEASRATGVDPRIIIAQSAQETGWGRSAPNFNFFGIKSHGQPGGATLATTEVGPGGAYRANESFRRYGSAEESVKDYADFINRNPRYEGFRTAQGLEPQLAALQKSGYATDPNYSRAVGDIAKRINLNEIEGGAVFAQPEKVTVDRAATPVYSQDIGTGIRRTGNFFFPSLVDAPTPLTPEQAATQKTEMAKQATELKGLQDANSVTKGFLAMMQMGQPKEVEQEILQNQIKSGKFVPLQMYRGLL
jgi:hypothetical protein